MNAARHTVPTLIGQYNQMAHQIGQGWYNVANTTINHKRGVATNLTPNADNPIKLQYFGIGIRGSSASSLTLGEDIIPIMVPFMPSEANMDLYHPIPVRMVLQGSDIEPEELAMYRMKTTYTAPDNSVYDVYWLKMVTMDNVTPIRFEKVLEGEKREAHTLSPALTPAHPDENEVPENIVVSTILQCTIAGYELDEVVLHMLGGNRALACISEIGLYSGADFISDDDTEAIGVQLVMHRCLRGHDLSSPNAQVTEIFALENGNSLIARSYS